MVSIELNVPCIAMILSFVTFCHLQYVFGNRNRKAESVGMNAAFDNFQGVATWEYRYCCGLQNTVQLYSTEGECAKRRRIDPLVSTRVRGLAKCVTSHERKRGRTLKFYFWEESRLQIV
jgi:hypothetical protein